MDPYQSPRLQRLVSDARPPQLEPAEVLAAVTAAVPDSAAAAALPLGHATSAAVFALPRPGAGGWVLKAYPRGEDDALRREVAALELLEGIAQVPTPRLVATDEHGSFLPVPFVVMTRLPGVVLADVIGALPGSDRSAVQAEMGRALRALHEVVAGGDIETMPATSLTAPLARLDRRLELFTEHGGDERLAAQIADAAAARLDGRGEQVALGMCHGDYLAGNVLVAQVDETWRVTGIVDFDRAGPGDPLYDAARPLFHARRAGRFDGEAFLRGYGSLSAGAGAHLFVHQLSHAIELWVWLGRTGTREAVAGVERDLARLVVS